MTVAEPGAHGTVTLLRAAFTLAWRASRWLLAARAGIALLGGLAPVAVAWLTKLLLDHLAGDGSDADVLAVVLALASAGLVGALMPSAGEFVDAEMSRRTQLAGREELFRAIGGFAGLGRFEDPDFQDRLQVAVAGGPATPAQVAANGLAIAQSTVTIAGFVAVLASMAPWMALVVAVAAIPTVRGEMILARARAAMMLQLGHATRRELFYADLISSVTAAKEVRLYGLSNLFATRMGSELRKINRGMRSLDLRELRMQSLLTGLAAVVAGGGLVWAALSARSGGLGIGDIVVFAAATGGVQNLLAQIIGGFARTHQALLIFRHFREVTGAPADLAAPDGLPVRAAPPLRDGIRFKDVWFRYAPTLPWILQGVNLTIRAGEATALVGLNGAGKSTIVKLLCRFYDPTRGTVLWDGVDVRRFDVADLRERLGAVFQDFMSYDLTAAENIGLGDVARIDDRPAIEATAGRAGVNLTVEKLPKGYDTLLTRYFSPQDEPEDEPQDEPQDEPADEPADGLDDEPGDSAGVLLSGGQWQRIALARAFMRADRDLLILDEPSAGLDAGAEHEVHTRLRALRAGATSVLISHRLSTVRDADTIAVLSGGVVAELGDHATLLAGGGIYAGLYTLQASGYAEELHPPTGG
ncbi:ABC transporter ATP-binding protein [Actinoplanes sp. CA-252034]|uniref:ABC transporter ATP-binding protein n=1 Tax=Actinoplanes sp. CA-252034 TaxID=3239906 RepID=UPI003D9713C7